MTVILMLYFFLGSSSLVEWELGSFENLQACEAKAQSFLESDFVHQVGDSEHGSAQLKGFYSHFNAETFEAKPTHKFNLYCLPQFDQPD